MRMDRYKEEPKKKRRSPLRILVPVILLLAAASAAAVMYSYRNTLDSLAISFTEASPRLEFGGDYSAMDFVKASVGDVKPSRKSLDSDTVGSKEIVYTVSESLFGGLLNPSKEFTLEYSVTDDVAPLMLMSGDGAVIERGTEFDINNVISYGDNADPEPELKIKGKVDTDKEGSYPLHVTVTDASGNSTEWDLTVHVADQLPSYEGGMENVAFSDFVSSYKGEGRSFGIDVSTWQGDINFKKVKAAGCEFAIIRLGWSEEGTVTLDTRFSQNLKRAKEAGLKTGIYLYSYDADEASVRASAAKIIEELDGETLDFPIVFDWEDFGHFQIYKMSFAGLNSLYDAFADELKKGGYDCMLYGSKIYLEKIWEDTDKRPVWLAHYTDKTDYAGPYRIWQASCTGRIRGISGDVDLDIMYD